MPIILRTRNEVELQYLLSKMDGWEVEDKLDVSDPDRKGVTTLRFSFASGDLLRKMLLTWLSAAPDAWEIEFTPDRHRPTSARPKGRSRRGKNANSIEFHA